MSTVFKWFKLLLENKWLLILVFGSLGAAGSNIDRLIPHQDVKQEDIKVVQLAVKPHTHPIDHKLSECELLIKNHVKNYH